MDVEPHDDTSPFVSQPAVHTNDEDTQQHYSYAAHAAEDRDEQPSEHKVPGLDVAEGDGAGALAAPPRAIAPSVPRKSPPRIIAFINPKSGGKKGDKVSRRLKEILGHENVFTLIPDGPAPGLAAALRHVERDGRDLVIVVCGGDGTVSWVQGELGKTAWPPTVEVSIAVLPLGTGNDLSRSLHWGAKYSKKLVDRLIPRIMAAKAVMMDRWRIRFWKLEDGGGARSADVPESEIPSLGMCNNYFSLGLDARGAYHFHVHRERKPNLFSSPFVNNIWYGLHGARSMPTTGYRIAKHFTVEVDGEPIHVPRRVRALLVLNTPSYMAGTNPWEKALFTPRKMWHGYGSGNGPVSLSDGKFEVIGFRSILHNLGMKGSRLRLVQQTEKPFYYQNDGEPWLMDGPVEIEVSHGGVARMLDGGVK